MSEIEQISSPYLGTGRKNEVWRIEQVDIIENTLLATVSMREFCVSNTDNNEFHLAYLTALEFVSQLQIIYMHVWAGIKSKTKEVWMIECHMKSQRPIKNPEKINVEMTERKMFKRLNIYYCIADHRVTDDQGGLFEISIKAMMP